MVELRIGLEVERSLTSLIKACLNGNRKPAEHLALPLFPHDLGRDARQAVEAGVGALIKFVGAPLASRWSCGPLESDLASRKWGSRPSMECFVSGEGMLRVDTRRAGDLLRPSTKEAEDYANT